MIGLDVFCGITATQYDAMIVDCVKRGHELLHLAARAAAANEAVSTLGADTRPLDEYARTVEAEFVMLKQLAEQAKWPGDLTPRIIAADKAWQAAKAEANTQKVSVVRTVGPDSALRQDIRQLTEALRERLAGGRDSWWTRKLVGPVRVWHVLASGAATAVAGAAVRLRSHGGAQ